MPSSPGGEDYGPFKDEVKHGEAGAQKGSKNLAGGEAREIDNGQGQIR